MDKTNQILNSMVIIIALTVLMSCGGTAENANDSTTNNQQADTTVEALTNQNEDAETSIGQATWQEFKMAIKSKDEAALELRCTDKIHDYEGLFFMLSELYVMRKMDEMQYQDLEAVEIEGHKYLEFYAEDIGEDEFGYEYGTSVTLHFIETEKGLFLDHYSAAG